MYVYVQKYYCYYTLLYSKNKKKKKKSIQQKQQLNDTKRDLISERLTLQLNVKSGVIIVIEYLHYSQ